MEEFKEYYKFPLKEDTYGYSKVWDATGNNNAFDFAMQFLFEEKIANIEAKDKISIVKIINGEDKKMKNDFTFTLEKGIIYLNKMPFIMIRGWGRLTGIGGFNLPGEKAAQIQDDFANYVLEKLQNAVVK